MEVAGWYGWDRVGLTGVIAITSRRSPESPTPSGGSGQSGTLVEMNTKDKVRRRRYHCHITIFASWHLRVYSLVGKRWSSFLPVCFSFGTILVSIAQCKRTFSIRLGRIGVVLRKKKFAEPVRGGMLALKVFGR